MQWCCLYYKLLLIMTSDAVDYWHLLSECDNDYVYYVTLMSWQHLIIRDIGTLWGTATFNRAVWLITANLVGCYWAISSHGICDCVSMSYVGPCNIPTLFILMWQTVGNITVFGHTYTNNSHFKYLVLILRWSTSSVKSCDQICENPT